MKPEFFHFDHKAPEPAIDIYWNGEKIPVRGDKAGLLQSALSQLKQRHNQELQSILKDYAQEVAAAS